MSGSEHPSKGDAQVLSYRKSQRWRASACRRWPRFRPEQGPLLPARKGPVGSAPAIVRSSIRTGTIGTTGYECGQRSGEDRDARENCRPNGSVVHGAPSATASLRRQHPQSKRRQAKGRLFSDCQKLNDPPRGGTGDCRHRVPSGAGSIMPTENMTPKFGPMEITDSILNRGRLIALNLTLFRGTS